MHNVTKISVVAVVWCSASAAVITVSEPAAPPIKPVAASQNAHSEKTTGFARTLDLAANPHLGGHAAFQPLVGPLRSVKAPNLRQNLSKYTGQKAKAFAGSVATLFAKGVVSGAGSFIGAKAMGRLK